MTDGQKTCRFCGEPTEFFQNYCEGIDCIKGAWVAAGGKVVAPNGLPTCCFHSDGNIYEHEHGGHPDYKYPVYVDYVAPLVDGHWKDYEAIVGEPAKSEEDVRGALREFHALIYTDGCVALTMYECCYYAWSLKGGEGGLVTHRRANREQRLNENSRQDILKIGNRHAPEEFAEQMGS